MLLFLFTEYLIDMILLFTTIALAINFLLPFIVGDVASLFAGVDYSSVEPVVIHRVKRLALICVHAVHQKRWVQISKAGT